MTQILNGYNSLEIPKSRTCAQKYLAVECSQIKNSYYYEATWTKSTWKTLRP